MKYTVINGSAGWGDAGTTVEITNPRIIDALFRSKVIADFTVESDEKESATVDSAETVINFEVATPIAIQEAMNFSAKKDLDEYAEDEHGIKLDRRKGIDKMKADFCDMYHAKMQKIEIQNKAMLGAPENK
jgi:hypothetical protein